MMRRTNSRLIANGEQCRRATLYRLHSAYVKQQFAGCLSGGYYSRRLEHPNSNR
jgi:hypothetical protein